MVYGVIVEEKFYKNKIKTRVWALKQFLRRVLVLLNKIIFPEKLHFTTLIKLKNELFKKKIQPKTKNWISS